MPRHYDIKLDKYEISPYRYRELLNFCLQYDEKKDKLEHYYSVPATHPKIDYVQDTNTTNPTQDKAIPAARLSHDVKLIEQTAIEADNEIYQYLLMNVTNQIPYSYLRYTLKMPCGKNKFYRARRKFFYLLDKKK
ncbi:MAG: hypothetical protein ACOXZ0_08325 [Eubacteriales bacterium]|jgi:hypothetical protein